MLRAPVVRVLASVLAARPDVTLDAFRAPVVLQEVGTEGLLLHLLGGAMGLANLPLAVDLPLKLVRLTTGRGARTVIVVVIAAEEVLPQQSLAASAPVAVTAASRVAHG
eukprot:8263189-Alexandrium_andersonii.AAC.1